MAIEKKLSKGTVHLKTWLAKEIEATLDGSEMSGDMEITLTQEKYRDVLEGYVTTVTAEDGSIYDRGVTVQDIQAVGNFRRDTQNAVRCIAGDAGLDYMTAHTDADSYRLTVSTPDNAMSIQSAFYRPGKEEQGNTNFISITDQWVGDDEDKAIEAHLKGLTKKLAGK